MPTGHTRPGHTRPGHTRPGHTRTGDASPEDTHPGRLRTAALAATRRLRTSADEGMATAEYAVATVAACGFGGVLYKVITDDAVAGLMLKVVKRAFTVMF